MKLRALTLLFLLVLIALSCDGNSATSRRILALSSVNWVASYEEDDPSNFAEVSRGTDENGSFHEMEWSSHDPVDLTLGDLQAFGLDGARALLVTLSASLPTEVSVWIGLSGSFCGASWRYVLLRDELQVGTEPRTFELRPEHFFEDPLGNCHGELRVDALEEVWAVVLLPAGRTGRLRVHDLAILEDAPTTITRSPSGSSQPGFEAGSQSLDWQLELMEPGLVSYVMRCRLPEDSEQFVGLQFDQLNAASYDFLQLEAKAINRVPVRIWVEVYDPALPHAVDSRQMRWVTTAEPLLFDSSYRVFQIVLAELRLPDEVLSQWPSLDAGMDPSQIRGIYFEPLGTETEIEISYVALHQSAVSEFESSYLFLDQISLWASASRVQGEWVVGVHSPTSSSWEQMPETLMTTSAWQGSSVHHQGGTLDVVDDSTGDDRGLVCRATVPPRVKDGWLLAQSGPQIERWDGLLISRVYAGVYFPHFQPPCLTSLDVYLDEELLSTAVHASSGTILLDVFARCSDPDSTGGWVNQYGEAQNSSLQVKLWPRSRTPEGHAYLELKYGVNAFSVAPRVEGAPRFTANEWHTISIAIHADGMAELYQDGLLVARHPTGPNVVPGTTGGHPGLYIHDTAIRGEYAVRGVFLYDNYRIQCGPDLDIAATVAGQAQ
ncbi:hypothetical protein ACFLSF_02755 [Candidatus Bipolaricaulota bacterium]